MTGAGWVRSTFICLAGSWAAWNGVRYVLEPSLRHRAESAWFIFAAVLLLAGLSASWAWRPRYAASPVAMRQVGAGALLVFCALAFTLYAPVLSVGLLSDDFVLLERARTGRWADPQWEYLRPLPLGVWWAVDRLLPWAAVPAALHALNIAGHGFNAWLVGRLALKLGLGWRDAMIAAVLFLSWPFSVEPVTWISGAFDVFMTTCVLLLTGTVLGDRRSPAVSIGASLLLTVAALACKETAVATPLLLAVLLPAVPSQMRRQAVMVVGVCGLVVIAYVLWRVTSGTADVQPVVSGYAAKELLSRPFGSLGLGLHVDVQRLMPAMALFLAVMWPVVFVRAALVWPSRPDGFWIAVLGCAWILGSALPLLTMFYVGPDLQGSRYLYLGSTLWSIAVVTLINPLGSSTDRRTLATIAVIVAISVTALFLHQRPWRRAAATVGPIVAAIDSLRGHCRPVAATGLPDNVDGAQAFRNGFAEAVLLTLGPHDGGLEPCHVHWDGRTLIKTD